MVDAFGRAKELRAAIISVRSPAFGTNEAFEVIAAVDDILQWDVLLGSFPYRTSQR